MPAAGLNYNNIGNRSSNNHENTYQERERTEPAEERLPPGLDLFTNGPSR
jgi:hypothetical protein